MTIDTRPPTRPTGRPRPIDLRPRGDPTNGCTHGRLFNLSHPMPALPSLSTRILMGDSVSEHGWPVASRDATPDDREHYAVVLHKTRRVRGTGARDRVQCSRSSRANDGGTTHHSSMHAP